MVPIDFIDYRKLNKIIIKDKFPIPFLYELLAKFHYAKYLYKLDMKLGC